MTPAAPEQDDDHKQTEKRVATLAAKFALAGHEMKGYRNNEGQTLFTVGRCGHIHHFDDLDKVDDFLRTLSPRHAPKGERHV